MSNFKEQYSGIYCIAFYFCLYADIETKQKKSLLLYSWILPVDDQKEQWHKRDIDKQIFVLFGFFPADTIKMLWELLLKGQDLDTACKNSNISIQTTVKSDRLSAVNNWILPINNYKYRPRCTYVTQSISEKYNDLYCSPSQNSIALVESLFCIDKDDYLIDLQLFKKNCVTLKNELGIDFFNSEAGRIGNIEWYSFPSGNIQEVSYVDTSTIKGETDKKISCKKMKVTFSSKASGEFLINTRMFNGNAVICDAVKELSLSGTEQEVEFDASEDISSFKITIWKKEEAKWTLWYENASTLIRSFGLRMDLHSSSGKMESKNILDVSKKTNGNNKLTLIKRVEDLQKIAIYSKASDGVFGEENNDPWRTVGREINKNIRTHFPEKSSSLFLPKGWEGQLQFYEWLKTLPKMVNDLSELFIIDPYLEEEAIRFIPLMGNSDVHYQLITNTKTLQDSHINQAKITHAAAQIIGKIKSLKVTIFDVSKDKQVIHDRYILLKSSEGFFVKGFHLSNSIQMANKNFPLLITEIPADILQDIQDWLSETLSSKLDVLWDSNKSNNQLTPVTTGQDKPEYATISVDDITSQIALEIKNWGVICKNAFNNNETSENLMIASESFTKEIWNEIFNFVSASLMSIEDEEIDLENETTAILQSLSNKDFPQTLDFADTLFDYLHPSYRVPPYLFYLIDYSSRSNPEKLLAYTEEVFDKYIGNNDKSLQCGIFFHKLFNSLVYLFSFYGGDEEIWLKSKIDLVSGFAASSICHKIINGSLNASDAILKISRIEGNKKIEILVKWIYEMRIKDNQKNNDAKINQLNRAPIFSEIIELWDSETSEARIKEILIRCGGPGGDGNWVISTFNELFQLLLNNGKVTVNKFWNVIKELCDTQLSYKTHFMLSSSLQIFEVFGFMIQEVDQSNYIKELTKNINKELGFISRPFAASISYNSYSDSHNSLHKLLILLVCINKYVKNTTQEVVDLRIKIIKQLERVDSLFTTTNQQLNEVAKVYIDNEVKI